MRKLALGIEIFPSRSVILLGLTALAVALIFFKGAHALVYVMLATMLARYLHER